MDAMTDSSEQARQDAPVEAALKYADDYFERSMVGKSIQAGDHFEALATAVRLLRAELEQAERERDEWREIVEKVGVLGALRDLIAAAEPLIGKPVVVPGKAKLPPEWYPAASDKIQSLRDAVVAARSILSDEAPLAEARLAKVPALVEALKRARWSQNLLSSRTEVTLATEDYEAIVEALTVWEQE